MNHSKLLLCKFILLCVLVTFTGAAYAEYYIVYPAPRPTKTCYERTVKPTYKKHHHYAKKIHRKYKKQHYVKARSCRSCHISISYYYPACPLYVNNEWSPCNCGKYCRDTYEFEPDRRTADDVTSELQLD